MKIRSKLFILLTVLALVPLMVLGAVSYTIARGAVLDKAQEQLTKVRDELAASTTRNLESGRRIGEEIAADQNFALYLTYLGVKDVTFLQDILKKVLAYHMNRDPRILAIVVRFPVGEPVSAMRRAVTLPADVGSVSVAPIGDDAFCITTPTQRGENKATVHVVVDRTWFTGDIDRAAIAADRPVAGFLVAGGRLFGAARDVNTALLSEPFASEPWIAFGDRVAASGPVTGTPFYVGASMAEGEFLAPARGVRNTSLLIILLVAALVVAASLGFATTLVKPIAGMVKVARRVSGGDLEARVDTRRADELGDLGRDFDTMTSRLKSTIGDLDKRVRELSTLYEATAAINQSENLEEVLMLAGELLASGFGVTRAAFLKADARSGEKRFVPVRWQGREAPDLKLPSDLPAVRRAFDARASVLVEKFKEDAGIKAALPAEALESANTFLLIPIIASKREVGLILVLESAEPPDDEDRRMFAVLGSLVAPLFVTAAPARGRVFYDGARDDLSKLLERVDRMDTRCTVATVSLKGDPTAAVRLADAIQLLLAVETPHVYRASPAVLLAYFPGLAPLPVEMSVTRIITEKEPQAAFAVKVVCYPDDDESADGLLARGLSAD